MARKRIYHEQNLQFRVVGYLRDVLPRDAVFWSVPNGGKMSHKAGAKARDLGQYKGASDLMICYRGRLHCLELKVREDPRWGITETTYQKPEQKAFQADIEAAGAPYVVARHTSDVRDALALWGIPTREKVVA